MFDVFYLYKKFRQSIELRDLIIIFVIISIYLLSRLINLDKFPIFSDEGIYLRWAKVAWHDASWRFISLTDGKQPLQTWATIPFLKLFPNDALFAGRLFAVSSGLFALSGMITIAWFLFGKRAAFIAGLLYVFTPYFLFYDRLALVDSAVNGFFIWILFLSILLAKYRRFDIALLFGLVGGLGTLGKSSVQLFLGLSALAPILFYEKNRSKFISNAINFFLLLGVGAILSIVIYNVQRLSPFFHIVAEKNKTFVYTLEELIQNPFASFFTNIKLIPLYVSWESGFIVTLLGILGLILLKKDNIRLFWYFLLWILVPFTLIAFFSEVLFPRYIIFFASILVLCAAYYIDSIKNKKHLLLAVELFGASVFYFHYTILFDQKNIPLPPVDRGQYIEAWPAGWGAKEIVEYARDKSKDKPVIILAEGNFGMAGDVLDTLLRPDDRITIRGYWPLDEAQIRENQKELEKNYVYAVFPHRSDYPGIWPIKLIQKYDKPGGKSALYFFELTH